MLAFNRSEYQPELRGLFYAVAFAVVAFVGYTYIASHFSLWTYGTILESLPYFPIYGPAALFLVCAYYFDLLNGRPHLRFLGKISPKLCAYTLLLVSLAYIASWVYMIYAGINAEYSMVALHVYMQSASALQIAILSLSLLILVPIAEELLYRHFLLGIFNFPPSLLIQLPLVIVVAVFFALHHSNYENTVTLVLMFLLACIFGCARVLSGGIALPIFLHAYSVLLGVTISEIHISLAL